MIPGSLVRFNVSLYKHWGICVVLREYNMVDRDGRKHPGYYYVLTPEGEKLISDHFMELI
jgi:hypothetical protein